MKSDQRPRSVTWLTFAVLIFSAIFIIRFIVSFQIPSIEMSVPVWYFTLTGGLWGTIGIWLSIGLYVGRRWASVLTRWLSLVFVAWYWLDRFLFVKTDFAGGSTVAAIVASTLCLIAIYWILLSPKAASYFDTKSLIKETS